MAKKRGNIKLVLKIEDGIGYFRLRHEGRDGRRTLGRFCFPMADKPALIKAVGTWMAATHPKLRQPEEAS